MDRKRKFSEDKSSDEDDVGSQVSEITSSDEDYELYNRSMMHKRVLKEYLEDMTRTRSFELLQDVTVSEEHSAGDLLYNKVDWEVAGSIQPYPKRTIKVQALNGETCTVEAYRFDRAKDVKAKACEKLRLSTERRTLVYNGKELDDMSDLSSIDTSVECKFQLLPKTGLGLVDSVKSLFEYFRNGAHRLVEWFPDFFMDMSRALTEKDLSRISQAIGSGWKHLGAELGISQAEIDQICEDNRKTSMKIFNMLRQWSIQASVNATVNTLHNAMKNCRKVTFDMKAIERVFAGI